MSVPLLSLPLSPTVCPAAGASSSATRTTPLPPPPSRGWAGPPPAPWARAAAGRARRRPPLPAWGPWPSSCPLARAWAGARTWERFVSRPRALGRLLLSFYPSCWPLPPLAVLPCLELGARALGLEAARANRGPWAGRPDPATAMCQAFLRHSRACSALASPLGCPALASLRASVPPAETGPGAPPPPSPSPPSLQRQRAGPAASSATSARWAPPGGPWPATSLPAPSPAGAAAFRWPPACLAGAGAATPSPSRLTLRQWPPAAAASTPREWG